MKLRHKKGFTIIELVIVIAVIGILTAVLVPTFINLTNKANEAADQSLVKNLNTVLATAEADVQKGYKKPNNPSDMFDILDKEGYKGETLLKNQKSGKTILYKLSANRFEFEDDTQSGLDYWEFKKDNAVTGAKKYSIYLYDEYISNEAITVSSGLDVGTNDEANNITYSHTGAAQTAVVRTNGGLLNVNAPNDTMKHYGEGVVLNIGAIADTSYHEFGYFPKAIVNQGRIVVEEKGQIQVLDVSNATAAVVVEKTGSGEIENVVKGDNTHVTVAEDLVQNIATSTTVSTWSELKEEIDNANGADVINIGQALTGANESINIARDVTILGNGYSVTGHVNCVASKVYMTTSYYGIFNIGNPNAETDGLNVFIDNLDITNTKTSNKDSTCINYLNTATNATLTLSNANLKAGQYAICTEMLSTGHNLFMKKVNFDPSCYNALNWFSSNGNIIADYCNFTSTNTSSGDTNSFTTICINSAQVVDSGKTIWNYVENNTITFNNCKIVANQLGACRQALLDIRSPYNNVLNLNNSDWDKSGGATGSLYVATEKWADDLAYVDIGDNNKHYYPAPGSKAVGTASLVNINGENGMNNLNVVSQKFFRNGQTSWGMYCYTNGLVNWDPNTALNNETYDPVEYQYINNGNGTWTIKLAD